MPRIAPLRSVIVVVVLAAGTARAAPPTEAIAPEGDKSGATALALSAGGVLASGLVIGAGAYMNGETASYRLGQGLMVIGSISTLITPSLGEIYAGESISYGLRLRGVGLAVGAGFTLLAGAELLPDPFGSVTGPLATLIIGGVIGGGLYVAGMIHDIACAPSAADRYNAHRLRVAPTIVPTSRGNLPGLALAGRF